MAEGERAENKGEEEGEMQFLCSLVGMLFLERSMVFPAEVWLPALLWYRD